MDRPLSHRERLHFAIYCLGAAEYAPSRWEGARIAIGERGARRLQDRIDTLKEKIEAEAGHGSR